ncbi:MAG: chromophore lyase CpcT/CpeT [Pseudomonadota bacterium]
MAYSSIPFRRLAALAAAVCISACSSNSGNSSNSSEIKQTSIDSLAVAMKWWDGDYNNDRQIESLLAAGKPVWRADDSGEGGHIEVTSHYRFISLPAIGPDVIYVEETKHGDPDNIFRQRIYTLTATDGGGVRVKLWNFKDKKAYVGAWQNLDRLQTLTPDELSPLPDKCDLLSEWQGNKLHLAMQDKACAFGDRYFNYQVLLGRDSFWFRDKIVRLEDDVILTTAGDFTYHELDRIN